MKPGQSPADLGSAAQEGKELPAPQAWGGPCEAGIRFKTAVAAVQGSLASQPRPTPSAPANSVPNAESAQSFGRVMYRLA